MASPHLTSDPESLRLEEEASRELDWKKWGTYLPERQWGTVREDYSHNGDSWRSFTHEDATKRTFRWGEDGLLGWSDRKCRLGFSIALWNGKDPILKERLFGLTNPEGNHGEDVKELYYYLAATPTHSYCKGLYKYPIDAFPYEELRQVNQHRGYHDPEYELLEATRMEAGRFVDVTIEYAKAGPEDTRIRVTLHNQSDETVPIHLLGQAVYRNTWTWGCTHEGCTPRPEMALQDNGTVALSHLELGNQVLKAGSDRKSEKAEWLFTENDSNMEALFGVPNSSAFTKDAFHRRIVDGDIDAVNPSHVGTKCAAHYELSLKPGETREFRFSIAPAGKRGAGTLLKGFDETFDARIQEFHQFYEQAFPELQDEDSIRIHRQAMAGMLWSKQFYHYSVLDWEQGDPDVATPPPGRGDIRNGEWEHLFSRDILSMPDKWEYPWFAAWDSAFHMIPFAQMDLSFARNQLLLFLREWYQHPNGQIPAYEFNFSDVNPPVHAWACREVYRISKQQGKPDLDFLEQSFHKLLINFTWWVNRKDPDGRNIFSGGFLGLDNIGPFDRSHPPPGLSEIQQADGTAWMAFFCAMMLELALELARSYPAYDGIASKFFEHFMNIADALNHFGGDGLWDEEDGFYYDHLGCCGDQQHIRVRSMVGLVPLFAVILLDDTLTEELPGFTSRAKWFLNHRRDLVQSITWQGGGTDTKQHLLAIPSRERLERVLRYVLDEEEFLSPFGIRSLSKKHAEEPFEMHLQGTTHRVAYLPAESDSGMFGGNSNWRGPIWFPMNYLLIESLRSYHQYYGDSFQMEFPTGSGNLMTLDAIADQIAHRLSTLFRKGDSGRPCHGGDDFYEKPEQEDLILFYEYFHADTGRGCGASHQTGWTGLMASLLRS